VQLILAGPDHKTGREPLAWIEYPASQSLRDSPSTLEESDALHAWNSAIRAAAANVGRQADDIGYAIHDAGTVRTRTDYLQEAFGRQVPAFNFKANSFDTPSLLGNMGAGTSLTN